MGFHPGDRGRVPVAGFAEWRGWEYLDEARRVGTLKRLKHAVTASLSLPEGDRALDLGCGTGDDLAACADAQTRCSRSGSTWTFAACPKPAAACWSSKGIAFAAADAHYLPWSATPANSPASACAE